MSNWRAGAGSVAASAAGDERRRAIVQGSPAWRRSSRRSRRRTARRRRRWRARARLRRGRRRDGGARTRCRAPRPAIRGTSRSRGRPPGVDERARVRVAAPLVRRHQHASPARGDDRLGDPVLGDQQQRQVVPGVAERRRDLDRAPARGFAFRPLPAPAQQAAEVRQRLRALGELEAAPEGALRLVGLARCFSTLPRLFQMPATSGATSTARRSRCERGSVLAALMLQHAHVVESVGMIRPALEQCRVDHLRVVELVELVALDRQRQRLFRRQAQLALRRRRRPVMVGAGVSWRVILRSRGRDKRLAPTSKAPA